MKREDLRVIALGGAGAGAVIAIYAAWPSAIALAIFLDGHQGFAAWIQGVGSVVATFTAVAVFSAQERTRIRQRDTEQRELRLAGIDVADIIAAAVQPVYKDFTEESNLRTIRDYGYSTHFLDEAIKAGEAFPYSRLTDNRLSAQLRLMRVTAAKTLRFAIIAGDQINSRQMVSVDLIEFFRLQTTAVEAARLEYARMTKELS